MKLYKVVLYTLLFPYTFLIVIMEIVNHFKNQRNFKEYSFESYKRDQHYQPTLKSKPSHILVPILLLIGVYLLVSFTLEVLELNRGILIALLLVVLVYDLIVIRLKATVKKLMRKKYYYQLGLEQEEQIEQHISELNHQINIEQLKTDLKYLESVFDFITGSKKDTKTINDVLGYEELIFLQYNDIKRYYDKQLNYLQDYIKTIHRQVSESVDQNKYCFEDLNSNKYLTNQKRVSLELVDDLLRYITNFNSFMEHNVTEVIDLTKPLNEAFANYLKWVHAFDHLNDQQYHEILMSSMSCLEFNQLKEIISNRLTIINSNDSEGNTLLHLAAMLNKVALTKFLLKQDAKINAKNKKGYTALHYAMQNDNRELSDLLVTNGAFIEFVIHDLSK